MRIGLITSFIIHASILLAAVVVLPDPKKFLPEPNESIPVEIIEFTDISQRVATTTKKSDPVKNPLPPKVEKVDKPEPKTKPAKEVKKAALEPEPEPVPEPEPKKKAPTPPEPDPVKDLIEKVEKRPEPKPEPEPEPKKAEAVAKPIPVPRRKPKVPKSFQTAEKKKKKKKLDLNKLSALLNKIDDKRTAPPPEPTDDTGIPLTGDIDSLLGRDQKLTGSEADWLRQKVQQCWSPPVGVRGAASLVVKVGFSLDISGTVLGTPRVLNGSNNPLFGVAADAAVRAILRCQPYDGLPPEKHRQWSNNVINFDPSRMLQ